MRPTAMTLPTLLLTLLFYALGIGAAMLIDTARGTGYDAATAVAFGATLHAAVHFGYLYRESRWS